MRAWTRVRHWWAGRRATCDSCGRYEYHIAELRELGERGALQLAERFYAAHRREAHSDQTEAQR